MPKFGAWSSTSLFRLAIVYSATTAPFVLVECRTQFGRSRRDRRLEPLEQVEPARVEGGGRAQPVGREGEVARCGACEGRPEEELVAVGGELERLVELSRGVLRVAFLGGQHQLVSPVERVQAAELLQWIRVVVDAQVDLPPADHQQRGRLAAAHVAALRLRGVEGRQYALVERPAGRLVGGGHGV